MKTSDRNYYGVKLVDGTTLICETKSQAERVRNAIQTYARLFNNVTLIDTKRIATIAYNANGVTTKEILTNYVSNKFSLVGA